MAPFWRWGPAVGFNSRQGRVQVYLIQEEFGDFRKLGDDIVGEDVSNSFGTSVALSDDGTILAAGAYSNSGVNGDDSGHIRVFQWQPDTEVNSPVAGDWVQLGSDIDGEAQGDWFGTSISLSADGRTVAAGATTNGLNETGHVRVFTYDGTSLWTQLGPDIDGDVKEGYFGHAVSLASDGRTVAIGAPRQLGSNFGAVWVYQWSQAAQNWTVLGSSLEGSDFNGWFGYSVSLSSNGRVIAIGSWASDLYGTDSGHVQIHTYNDDTNSWNQVGQDLFQNAGDRFGTDVALSADWQDCGRWGSWRSCRRRLDPRSWLYQRF